MYKRIDKVKTLNKISVLLGFLIFLIAFALMGCSEQEIQIQPSNEPIASELPTNTPALTPEVSSAVTQPVQSEAVSEVRQVKYNGLSFEINGKYEFQEKDGMLSITFEKGIAYLTISFFETNLTDRETETALINGLLLSGFSERQNEVKHDVDINGTIAKATMALIKAENTSWLNALCLTVPTETGNVTFLFIEANGVESDYSYAFEDLINSIIVG